MAADKSEEGGFIRALINMHIKALVKNFLPKFNLEFSNEHFRDENMDCYGL